MRDVGILIWVAFLIVGVIGSISSSIRKQRPPASPAPIPPQWGPRTGLPAQPAPSPPPAQVSVQQQRLAQVLQSLAAQTPPQPVAPRPPPPPRPAPALPSKPKIEPPHSAPEPARRRPIFQGPSELVRAVIAAEVLGKPRGLSDEYFPH
jgi:hypothetical protein